MKRSNLLKVLSVVMVVAMLMLSSTSALAAVTAVQSATDTTVTISGTIEGAQPYTSNVTITVLKPGVSEADVKAMENNSETWSLDKFAGAGSAMVKEGGAFECTIKLEDSENMPCGNYTVIVSPTNDGVALADRSTTFYFTNSDDKLEKLQEIISETNAAALVTKINDNKVTLSLDTDNWDQLATVAGLQEKAAAAVSADLVDLRAKVEDVTLLNDFATVVKAIVDESYAQMVAGGILSNIDDLGDYVEIEAYTAELQSDKIDPTLAQTIPGILIGSGVSNLNELASMYKEKILLAGVVHPAADNTLISREFLSKFANDAGLTNGDKFATLSDKNQVAVAEMCRKSGATTLTALNEVFAAAVAGFYVPVQSSTPNNGNGGGGGAGSTTILTPPTPTPSATPENKLYNDIDNVEWAWEAIEELSNRNIFAGYEDGSFAPDNAILREEFIKIAVVGTLGASAIDSAAVPSFTDAQSGWFAPYVAAAETNNITSGIGDGLFGTGTQITRQDMALMLYRMLRDAGINTNTDAYAFTDADQIEDYAAEAVYALKNMGIINGDPDGSLRPAGSTTRAEAAVLLYKTLDKLGKIVR